MKVPAFADIGKVSRDLLFGGKEGKFQYDKTVSFKTKAQDNVEFTVNSTMKADTVDAQLKAALKLANGISGDVTLKPESKIGVSASLAHFPGLKATLSGTVPDLNSGKVTVDYAVDYLSLKMSSALNSKPTLDLAGSTGMKGFVVGGEVGYNVEKAALSKYGVAAGYVGSGFSLAVAASDMLKTYKANYHQAIDTSSSVALEFTTKQGQEGVVSFVLGYARKMDNGAQTKVRIDQEGLLSMHYETVLEKHLKVALSAQMDALNLDGKKNKFGVALDFC